jgi:hypothetical protein
VLNFFKKFGDWITSVMTPAQVSSHALLSLSFLVQLRTSVITEKKRARGRKDSQGDVEDSPHVCLSTVVTPLGCCRASDLRCRSNTERVGEGREWSYNDPPFLSTCMRVVTHGNFCLPPSRALARLWLDGKTALASGCEVSPVIPCGERTIMLLQMYMIVARQGKSHKSPAAVKLHGCSRTEKSTNMVCGGGGGARGISLKGCGAWATVNSPPMAWCIDAREPSIHAHLCV